ncbi:MAG: hypothetical protein AAGC55_11365 [Myxococcota bacterium]
MVEFRPADLHRVGAVSEGGGVIVAQGLAHLVGDGMQSGWRSR